MTTDFVIPAEAGIQGFQDRAARVRSRKRAHWIPAFAGMTEGGAGMTEAGQ